MKAPTIYTIIRWLPLTPNARMALLERATDREYRNRIEEARMSGGSASIADLQQEHQHETYTLYQDREVIYTRHLLRTARRLRVPIPSRYTSKMEPTDEWEQSYDGAWYLSEAGEEQLRSSIRKEKKERAELRDHWVKWVTAITGAIGALTGLVAVWLSRQ
ncbi:MAG: hypothetical protein M3O61_15385 [Gemmatimonadota bacterium]|nr:hypothetical protein [Gemmatimonadota bacterium]